MLISDFVYFVFFFTAGAHMARYCRLRGRSLHLYLAPALPPPAPSSGFPCPTQHEGESLYMGSDETGHAPF